MSFQLNQYSKALSNLFLENNAETNYQTIWELNQALKANPQIIDVWSSAAISAEQRKKMVSEILGENQSLINFIAILIDHKTVGELLEILKLTITELQSSLRYTEVNVYTFATLTQVQREKIINKIKTETNTKVQYVEHLDKDLLGGMAISYNGVTFDYTLRSKISLVKKEAKGTYHG